MFPPIFLFPGCWCSLTVSCLHSSAQVRAEKLSTKSGRSSPPRSPPSPRMDDIHANNRGDSPGSPGESRRRLSWKPEGHETTRATSLSRTEAEILNSSKNHLNHWVWFRWMLWSHNENHCGNEELSNVFSTERVFHVAGRDASLVVAFICKVGHLCCDVVILCVRYTGRSFLSHVLLLYFYSFTPRKEIF